MKQSRYELCGLASREVDELTSKLNPVLPRLKVLGDGPGPRLKLAKAWFDREEYDKAKFDAEAALRVNSNLFLAHFLLAEIAMRQANETEAISRYRIALALNPRFAAGHHRLGDFFAQHGKPHEALAAYTTALAIDGKSALVRAKLGALNFELRDFRRAAKEYQKAAQIDPKFGERGHTVGDFHGLLKSLVRRSGPVPASNPAPRSL